MEIQLRTSGSVTILDISGNLTIGRSEENLRETVKRLIDEERRFLLLNLSEVPTIDSSGIGAMIKSFTSVKEANGKLKILKPSRMAGSCSRSPACFQSLKLMTMRRPPSRRSEPSTKSHEESRRVFAVLSS